MRTVVLKPKCKELRVTPRCFVYGSHFGACQVGLSPVALGTRVTLRIYFRDATIFAVGSGEE